MNVTNIMKEQMAMLENALESAIENNFPPLASRFIFNSPMYNQYLGKVEDVLLMHMDEETGEIDGKQAHETLDSMFPAITKWVSVPQTKFFISDEINKIAQNIIGKDIL